MKSPRHLWSGAWREESERARDELARRQDAVAERAQNVPPAAAPPPAAPVGRARRLRPVWLLVSAAVLAVGAAFAIGALMSGGNEDVPAALPAVAAKPLTAPKGKTRTGVIYERASPAVVSIRAGSGSGTGFLVQDRRTIVTNAHVVESATNVTVRFGADGRDLTGRVLGSDPSSDLAVVQISSGDAPADARALQLADSRGVQVGDDVIAIGNPFGLDRTATEGIVSGLGRRIQAPNGFEIGDAIQTDAPINPGNSGGPLLDTAGLVIGVNSQIENGGGSQGNVGIGFAVSSNSVRQVVPKLARGQRIARAWLGVESAASTAGKGGEVRSVTSGGPAQRAGIRSGDLIVAIDGKRVNDFSDIAGAVQSKRPGDKVDVRIERAGRRLTRSVTLGTRPAQRP